MSLTKNMILSGVATVLLTACANDVSGPKAQRIEISTDAPVAGASCQLSDSKGNTYRVNRAPAAVSVLRNGGPLTIMCSLEGYKTTSLVITEQARGGSSNFMGLAGGGADGQHHGGAGPWYPQVNILEMVPGHSEEVHFQKKKVVEYSPAMRTRPLSDDDLAMAAKKQMTQTQMDKPLLGSLAPTPTPSTRPVTGTGQLISPPLRPLPNPAATARSSQTPNQLTPRQQLPVPGQASPRQVSPAPAVQSGGIKGGYTIQAGAFGNPANANRMATSLRAQGFGVVVEPVQRQGRMLYSVRVGFFQQSSAAKAALQTFQQRSGIQGFVVARQK